MALRQTIGIKGDPDREFMTQAEYQLFKSMVKDGAVSFYRIGRCEECRAEIHKSKRFCSKKCAEREAEEDGSQDESE